MGTDPSSPWVKVDDVGIDDAIRTTEISASVSKVATNLGVRDELCSRQRVLIAESVETSGGVVAEGRDITTVVAPGADVRILMVAHQEARLARRAKELHGEADHAAMSATNDQMRSPRQRRLDGFAVHGGGPGRDLAGHDRPQLPAVCGSSARAGRHPDRPHRAGHRARGQGPGKSKGQWVVPSVTDP